MSEPQFVIFTGLVGVLLDRRTGSYSEAAPALELIGSRDIPLVFCSSKTRAEQEEYRRILHLNDPFVVEDGGAVYVPKDYFSEPYAYQRSTDNYQIIELGTPYWAIRKILPQVAKETGLALCGFGDMTSGEIAAEIGLDIVAARRAMAREYEEILVTQFTPQELEHLSSNLAERSLKVTYNGRFYGVTGFADKGEAASHLIALYRRRNPALKTIGIGESLNDVPLLSMVDIPVLVQNPGGIWEDFQIHNLQRVEGIGPIGWNRFVLEFLKTN